MNSYKFQTDYLAISETGIHLLRSKFNYKTIEFSAINVIRIKQGRQINNWIVSLIFGLLLSGASLFMLYNILYEYFIGTEIHNFYVEQFILPVLPLFAGAYCIYVSFKKGLILQITSNKGTKKLPLEDLNKQHKLEALTEFFGNNELTKYKFRVPNF